MTTAGVMGNMNRISNSELALCTLPDAMLGNAMACASGQIPLFAAHEREQDLMQQKLNAELAYMASNAMEPGLEKMAKEKAKSFAIKI